MTATATKDAEAKRVYNVAITRLPAGHTVGKPVYALLHAASLSAAAKSADKLPATIDLRTRPCMPPVYDQGHLGSCTANALCAAVQYDIPTLQGSRLFLYYNERKMEKDIPDDAGALLSDGIVCLERYGVCPEAEWPYDVAKFADRPPNKCYLDATLHRVTQVHSVPPSMSIMKGVLAAGYPFAVGIAVYASFETDAVATTGSVPMPHEGEACLGGHAVLCVGYDDVRGAWIMRNSWGAAWGDHGYFYLPYAYLMDAKLASDCWAITRVL
jgi:C1A family cysteine protease